MNITKRGNLILQRYAGESVQVGDDVTITVHEVSGRGVRLAIEAPPSVKILRHELVGTVPRDGASGHRRLRAA